MLMHNLDGMVNEKWLSLVQKTKKGVLTRPDQYISEQPDISEREQSVIEDIFKDFIERMERSHSKS
ncbi:MAG TPA: hypothetical protein VK658_17490 [Chryseolinea sp.]|nr:hypothetical protein [Chryseolinea sp.]